MLGLSYSISGLMNVWVKLMGMMDNVMNSGAWKKLLLRCFVGFLSLAAVIAILCVVAGDFGEFQARVFLTTLTLSAVSLFAMSAAALIEFRGQRLWGAIGIGMSVLTGGWLIGGIWGEGLGSDYWRTAMSLCAVAVALAHGFLLALPRLAAQFRWTYWVGPVGITVLTGQIILAVWEFIDADWFFRSISVNAILVVLLSLLVPVFMRLGGAQRGLDNTVTLTRCHDNVFRDTDGFLYRLVPETDWEMNDE